MTNIVDARLNRIYVIAATVKKVRKMKEFRRVNGEVLAAVLRQELEAQDLDNALAAQAEAIAQLPKALRDKLSGVDLEAIALEGLEANKDVLDSIVDIIRRSDEITEDEVEFERETEDA